MAQNNDLNNTSSTFNADSLSVNSAYTFPIAAGTEGNRIETDGSEVGSWDTNNNEGNIVQTVYNSTSSKVDCNTTFPRDDTIPQNTEGDEVLTVTITPTSSTNDLIIRFTACTTVDTRYIGFAALFQDSTANALAVNIGRTYPYVLNYGCSTSLTYYMAAGTTSSTTFKIRMGGNANDVEVNGYQNSRIFGGVSSTHLFVQEVKV